MKEADKDKPIKTIPKGVWESSRPKKDRNTDNKSTISTDAQGNGYPEK